MRARGCGVGGLILYMSVCVIACVHQIFPQLPSVSLRNVMEGEGPVDTGYAQHYKVNPCVTGTRADGLTCRDGGGGSLGRVGEGSNGAGKKRSGLKEEKGVENHIQI